MKIGALKASIRATKGNPVIHTSIGNGPVMALALQKAVLLEQLDEAFPGGKAVETELTFNEKTGVLSAEYTGIKGEPVKTTVSELAKNQGESGPLLDIMEGDLLTDDETAPATTLDDLFV